MRTVDSLPKGFVWAERARETKVNHKAARRVKTPRQKAQERVWREAGTAARKAKAAIKPQPVGQTAETAYERELLRKLDAVIAKRNAAPKVVKPKHSVFAGIKAPYVSPQPGRYVYPSSSKRELPKLPRGWHYRNMDPARGRTVPVNVGKLPNGTVNVMPPRKRRRA